MEHQEPEPKPRPSQERAAYEAPAIVYEAALEVRAGTPLGKRLLFPDLTDPAGLWKKK
jgi:hypothetical protein